MDTASLGFEPIAKTMETVFRGRFQTPNCCGGTQSPIEERLVSALQRFKVPVITQYQIGCYFADIFIESDKMVVECDGAAFHTDKEKDDARDKFMKDRGYQVLRFTGTEITRDAVGVASQIICRLVGSYPLHDAYLERLTELQDEAARVEQQKVDQEIYY